MQNTFLSTETFAQYEDYTERLECRICLEEMEETNRPPPFCECRGNHSSIHQRCLREWARRAQKFRDGRGNLYFHCDLCRSPICMRVRRACRRKTGKQCCQEFQQNYCKLGIIFAIFLFFTGVLVISLWALLQNTGDTSIYIGLVTVCAVMSGFSLMSLVGRLAVACPEVVGGFVPLEEIRERNNRIANSFSQDGI